MEHAPSVKKGLSHAFWYLDYEYSDSGLFSLA